MEQHSPDGRSPHGAQMARNLRVEELERRIVELEGLDESAFGGFTLWDWWICVIGAVVVPALAMWWFAG